MEKTLEFVDGQMSVLPWPCQWSWSSGSEGDLFVLVHELRICSLETLQCLSGRPAMAFFGWHCAAHPLCSRGKAVAISSGFLLKQVSDIRDVRLAPQQSRSM